MVSHLHRGSPTHTSNPPPTHTHSGPCCANPIQRVGAIHFRPPSAPPTHPSDPLQTYPEIPFLRNAPVTKSCVHHPLSGCVLATGTSKLLPKHHSLLNVTPSRLAWPQVSPAAPAPEPKAFPPPPGGPSWAVAPSLHTPVCIP